MSGRVAAAATSFWTYFDALPFGRDLLSFGLRWISSHQCWHSSMRRRDVSAPVFVSSSFWKQKIWPLALVHSCALLLLDLAGWSLLRHPMHAAVASNCVLKDTGGTAFSSASFSPPSTFSEGNVCTSLLETVFPNSEDGNPSPQTSQQEPDLSS